MLSERFRRSLATAFTLLVCGLGIKVLSGDREFFLLALIAATVLVGREAILRGILASRGPALLPQADLQAIAASAVGDHELGALRDRIRAAIETRRMGDVLAGPLQEVDRLVDVHGRLAMEQGAHLRHLQEHPVERIDVELAALDARLPAATEATRALLEQNVEVLRLRRSKLEALRSSVEVAHAQRQVIEDSLKLFHDQVLVATSPDDMREPLARLTTNLRATEAILLETRGLVGLA